MKLRFLLFALMLTTTSAQALDRNETSFVRVTTGLLFLTMMCHDYQPLSDVLNYLGKQSMGQDRTKKLFLARNANYFLRHYLSYSCRPSVLCR
jgi:hypothetical protein